MDSCLRGRELVNKRKKETRKAARGRTGALLGRIGTQHVGQQRCMTDFLFSHELEQEAILSSQASSLEIFHAVCGKAIVEEVKFDPFLVETNTD